MQVKGKPLLAMLLASICIFNNGDEIKVPSLEFLDFLGDLVEHDGEWIDPLDMDSELMTDGEVDLAKLLPSDGEAEVTQ